MASNDALSKNLPERLPDWIHGAVLAAMEQAAISGLCRDGRLEIGAQKVRELAPQIGREEAFALASAIDESLDCSD